MAVKVTPGFQSFMAKKLAKMLDASHKIVHVSEEKSPQPEEPDEQEGIKLFTKSQKRFKESEPIPPPKMRRRRSSSSSLDLDEDLLRESAVDCDFILEKKGAYPDDRQRTAPVETIVIVKK